MEHNTEQKKSLHFDTWIKNVLVDPRLKQYRMPDGKTIDEWLVTYNLPPSAGDRMSSYNVQRAVQEIYLEMNKNGQVTDEPPDANSADAVNKQLAGEVKSRQPKIHAHFWVLNYKMHTPGAGASNTPINKYCIQKLDAVSLLERIDDVLHFLTTYIKTSLDGNAVQFEHVKDPDMDELVARSRRHPDDAESLKMASGMHYDGFVGKAQVAESWVKYVEQHKTVFGLVRRAVTAAQPSALAAPPSSSAPLPQL